MQNLDVYLDKNLPNIDEKKRNKLKMKYKEIYKIATEKIKKIKAQLRKAKKSQSKKGSTKEDRLVKLNDKLKKTKLKYELKKEMKNISLGTSKENYIDPRITLVFIKKYAIPIEKVFSSALIKKFVWASTFVEENPEFKF